MDLSECDAMTAKFCNDEQRSHVGLLAKAGSRTGGPSRLLFSMPGFSLAHIWFKSGFPLPLHAHDADCLYYVIGGSLRMGTQDLAAGDGFFVPSNVPYTYVAGEGGVELLEFRTSNSFDVTFPTIKRDYWEKLAKTMMAKQADWEGEERPARQFPDFG
ncbi:hypothetical protein ASE00_13555 [Sphingomonas sp. Root710]|nr:hypothetical protein ASE00_13555 [Sphingomonas sp. Root710]